MNLIDLLILVLGWTLNFLLISIFFIHDSTILSIFLSLGLLFAELYFFKKLYSVLIRILFILEGLPIYAFLSCKNYRIYIKEGGSSLVLLTYLQYIKNTNTKKYNKIIYSSNEHLLSETSFNQILNDFLKHSPYKNSYVKNNFLEKWKQLSLTGICQLNSFFDFRNYEENKKELILKSLLSMVESNKDEYFKNFEKIYSRKNSYVQEYNITTVILIRLLSSTLSNYSTLLKEKKELLESLFKIYFCNITEYEENSLFFSPSSLKKLILATIKHEGLYTTKITIASQKTDIVFWKVKKNPTAKQPYVIYRLEMYGVCPEEWTCEVAAKELNRGEKYILNQKYVFELSKEGNFEYVDIIKDT